MLGLLGHNLQSGIIIVPGTHSERQAPDMGARLYSTENKGHEASESCPKPVRSGIHGVERQNTSTTRCFPDRCPGRLALTTQANAPILSLVRAKMVPAAAIKGQPEVEYSPRAAAMSGASAAEPRGAPWPCRADSVACIRHTEPQPRNKCGYLAPEP